MVSLFPSFLLCVAINHELLCNCAITLLGCSGQKEQAWQDPPWEEWWDPISKALKICWNFETQMHAWDKRLRHRQGEYRVLIETGETRVIGFLWGLTEEWVIEIIISRARQQGTAILNLLIRAESLHRVKHYHLVEFRAAYTKPYTLEAHFHKIRSTWSSAQWALPLEDQHKQLNSTN